MFLVQQALEILFKILVGVSLLLPLLAGSAYTVPALGPKVFFFQPIVVALAGIYALLLLVDFQKYRIRLNILSWAILLWGASLLVSTLFGVDWYRSLWNTSLRLTGVVFLLHCIAYYFLLGQVLQKEDWRWMFRVFLGGGILAILFALIFEVGFPQALYQKGEEVLRAASTLGNAAFFGGFAMALVFVAYFLLAQEKQGRWFSFALAGAVVSLFGVLASGTRGAFLGLACGLLFLCVSLAVLWKRAGKEGRKHIFGTIGFMLLPLFIFGGVSLVFVVQNAFSVADVPAVERFVGQGATATLHTRLLAWNVAFESWKEKPLFGWWPGHFAYAFHAYYPPEILQYGEPETWFDVAHNVLLEALATQGIAGLFALLGLYGAAAFLLWQGYRQKQIEPAVVGVAGAFLVAHLVFGLFLFDIPTSYISLFLVLAFMSSQRHVVKEAVQKPKRLGKKVFLAGAIVLVTTALLAGYLVPVGLDRLFAKAKDNLPDNVPQAIAWYERAERFPSPYTRSTKAYVLNQAIPALYTLVEQGNKEDATTLFLFAEKELQELQRQEPLEVQHGLLFGHIYFAGAEFFEEQEVLGKAERVWGEALLKSPERQEFQYWLALAKFRLGKFQEALSLLE